MMHLNTDALTKSAPTKKPCIRDMHELITKHLPEQLVKLVPFDQLERRGSEIVAEHPRFAEEMPLIIQFEARRRAKFRCLQVVGGRTVVKMTTLKLHSHA